MSRHSCACNDTTLSPLLSILLVLVLLPFWGIKLMAAKRFGVQLLGAVLLVVGVAFWLSLALC